LRACADSWQDTCLDFDGVDFDNSKPPMATVLVRDKVIRPERDPESKAGPDSSTTSVNTIPPLGEPIQQKRFFFQRSKAYDVDAIATQASILHAAPDRCGMPG